ncbi:MAG: DUF4177 domain-containing protein [Asgard group archaeon]|nr:DUF4177 domain-containing protein [Asgard group archaeon]
MLGEQVDIWEYEIETERAITGKTKSQIMESLKKRGQDGWELVSVHPVTMCKQTEDWYIYKRHVQP